MSEATKHTPELLIHGLRIIAKIMSATETPATSDVITDAADQLEKLQTRNAELLGALERLTRHCKADGSGTVLMVDIKHAIALIAKAKEIQG